MTHIPEEDEPIGEYEDDKPGANEQLGLPRDGMKTVTIAFDVDGTLRCNCTPTCQDVNRRQIDALMWALSLKNTKVIVWSGGGADYARSFMSKFDLKGITYASKLSGLRPDIAVDDIQDTAIGKINLIVREK